MHYYIIDHNDGFERNDEGIIFTKEQAEQRLGELLEKHGELGLDEGFTVIKGTEVRRVITVKLNA